MDKSVLIVILLVLGVILILLWIWWKKLETVDDNNIDRNHVIGNNSYYNTGNTPGPRFVRTIVYTNYREIKRVFANTDEEELSEALKVNGVFFSKDGKIGIDCSVDLDMGYLEECGIGPDENFGIAVAPGVRLLPSSEEFLDYFG